MNRLRTPQRILFLVVLSCFAAGWSHAQLLMSVDFNAGSGSPSPTQAGYLAFNVGSGSITTDLSTAFSGLSSVTSTGSVTVTIGRGTASSYTARDRSPMAGSGTFGSYNLYSDFTSARTLSLSGLNPFSTYQIIFYAYDNSNSGSTTFTDVTSGSAAGSTTITSTASYAFDGTTPASIFSSSMNVTSNASGALSFTISGVGVNGFQLVAVPEASTSALLFGGVAVLFVVAKRRQPSALA